MEKIVALIDKLQELKNNEAALSEIAYYTQLLYAELMCAKSASGKKEDQGKRKKVSVIMPGYASSVISRNSNNAEREEVRMHEVTPREEIMVKEKPVPVWSNENHERSFDPVTVSSHTLFDEAEQRPYSHASEMTAGRELNEVMAEHTLSLNDKLKRENVELAAKLTASASVRDLSKAIGINDKFLFINELFRGDRDMFDRSVKTINECGNLEEAEYWIGRELKIKLGWQDKDNTVQQFYHLIRKRFA
jgi:hypothetical protein